MTEKAVRDLIWQAMSADEPPIRTDIVGGAVRSARTVRRRRMAAGAAVTAAVVPALAFGTPAIVTALGPAAAGRHTVGPPPTTGDRSGRHHSTRPADRYPFVRPVLPASSPEIHAVPVTDQSLGQLLVDELPAGARYSHLTAIVPSPTGRGRQAGASLISRTATGSGSIGVQLNEPRDAGSASFQCASSGVPCITYTLAGGIKVNELVSQAPNGESIYVTVLRPGVALVAFTEGTGKTGPGTRPPLTLNQLVAAALDPRWRFTVSRSFAEHARHLHVTQGRIENGG
jgi:hypothetical protein